MEEILDFKGRIERETVQHGHKKKNIQHRYTIDTNLRAPDMGINTKTRPKTYYLSEGYGMQHAGLHLMRSQRAEDIRKTTVENVISKTKTLKWRWVDHMLRDTGNKWTRNVSLWTLRFDTKEREEDKESQ
ncbi:unnamed protein product [Euphydryas editha]|uniref:Uncharacterized protein n=1 Tax=Euphydryas editha TaxID=104508 RepID=A0AAU9U6A1_EUPED|nr:unnamed protein product [Euphydryas editha]